MPTGNDYYLKQSKNSKMQNQNYLFRGYQKELKKWVYGDLIHVKNGGCWIFDYKNGFEDRIEVKPETVGQWTTAKDKSGANIFEGDIYKRYNYIYKVIFEDFKFCSICIGREYDFKKGEFEPIEDVGRIFDLPNDGACLIIGNVWENLELLK